MHKVQLITPAATSLVTVAELQRHLMLFGDTSYDAELQAILLQAEEIVSGVLGEYLVSTSVRERLFSWGEFTLAHKNVSNVVVSYYDTNNAPQVFNASNYVIDTSGEYPVIKPKATPTGLSTDFDYQGFISYDTSMSAVPANVKRAVLLVAGSLFEGRADSSEKKSEKAAYTAAMLLRKDRRW